MATVTTTTASSDLALIHSMRRSAAIRHLLACASAQQEDGGGGSRPHHRDDEDQTVPASLLSSPLPAWSLRSVQPTSLSDAGATSPRVASVSPDGRCAKEVDPHDETLTENDPLLLSSSSCSGTDTEVSGSSPASAIAKGRADLEAVSGGGGVERHSSSSPNAAPYNHLGTIATTSCVTRRPETEAACVGCVAAGADLLFLVRHGHVEAALAFLQYYGESPLDFTRADLDVQRTPIHWACIDGVSDTDTCRLLRAMVDRIETHPLDRVNWALTDLYGDHLISIAAESQKLSLVWPIVKEQPYYADHVERFPLSGWFWQWDWEALEEEEQGYFDPNEGEAFPANRSTGALTRLCLAAPHFAPDPAAVQACVRDGADVTFLVFLLDDPFLHRFLQRGNVACAKACLCTPHAIDFTIADGVLSATPLHYILLPYPPAPFQATAKRDAGTARDGGLDVRGSTKPKNATRKSAELVTALLHLVLDRLETGAAVALVTGEEETPVSSGTKAKRRARGGGAGSAAPDQIDWGQEMIAGLDFLNLAAFYGHLAVVWSILKQRKVRYFFPRRLVGIMHAAQEMLFHRRQPRPSTDRTLLTSDAVEQPPQVGKHRTAAGETFHIRVPVHPDDWAALTNEDRARFYLEKGLEVSEYNC